MSIECVKRQNIKCSRKPHICNYCGETIEAGSPYVREFLVNGGEHYEWIMHTECEKVSSEIWEYADPWDGMDHDCYCENVRHVYESFVCSKCEHKEECALNNHDDTPCHTDWFETYKQTKVLYDIFKTRYLKCTGRNKFGTEYYILEDRENRTYDSGIQGQI